MDGGGDASSSSAVISAVKGNDGEGGSSGKILQVLVRLHHLQPKESRAWRRLLVSADTNFDQFHWILQRAFDWRGYHLYEFKIGTHDDRRVGKPCIRNDSDDEDDSSTSVLEFANMVLGRKRDKSAKKTLLKKYLLKEGAKALYTYDMGDHWSHSILIEKILDPKDGEKYPQCVDGELLAPPEDCGSIFGFRALLRTMSKPPNQRTWDEKERLKWLEESYPDYDPLNFDPSNVSLAPEDYPQGIYDESDSSWTTIDFDTNATAEDSS